MADDARSDEWTDTLRRSYTDCGERVGDLVASLLVNLDAKPDEIQGRLAREMEALGAAQQQLVAATIERAAWLCEEVARLSIAGQAPNDLVAHTRAEAARECAALIRQAILPPDPAGPSIDPEGVA